MSIDQFTEQELASEEWRPVVGYEKAYQVSNLGRVRSRWLPRGRLGDKWRVLKNNKHGGRRCVTLSTGVLKKTHYVHRLVLGAFVGPCPEGMECLHWDDVGTNNRLPNLRWGTQLENCADQRRNGGKVCGEQVRNAKLTDVDVRTIRELRKTGVTLREIGERFGVYLTTIHKIVSGESWAHVGQV